MKPNSKIAMVALAFALTVLVVPGAASAHFGEGKSEHSKGMSMRGENQFGVNILGEGHGGFVGALSHKGSVSAVSATGFTLQTLKKGSFVVNATTAKIIRLPNTVIAISDIAVGDSVTVFGTTSGNNINASVVFDLKANVKPAKAKGTVTAVSGSNLTVQTKNNVNVNVSTDANTQVTKADGQAGAVSDVTVGSKVKLWGLWDNVLNVFSALKVKIK